MTLHFCSGFTAGSTAFAGPRSNAASTTCFAGWICSTQRTVRSPDTARHDAARRSGAGARQRADLVFLDEPTSGLDPLGRLLVRDLLHELRVRGTTVFLNSHLLGEVEATCDRVSFVKQDARSTSSRLGRPPRTSSSS